MRLNDIVRDRKIWKTLELAEKVAQAHRYC